METKEQIKEINQHISDALEQWAMTMLIADADEWAHLLDYSEDDAMNVIFMFYHVLKNVGIKNGSLNDRNASEKALRLYEFIKDYCGIDTIEISKRKIREGNETKIEQKVLKG